MCIFCFLTVLNLILTITLLSSLISFFLYDHISSFSCVIYCSSLQQPVPFFNSVTSRKTSMLYETAHQKNRILGFCYFLPMQFEIKFVTFMSFYGLQRKAMRYTLKSRYVLILFSIGNESKQLSLQEGFEIKIVTVEINSMTTNKYLLINFRAHKISSIILKCFISMIILNLYIYYHFL